MNVVEFLDEFNVLYNNLNSNQAPGLNEYQISVLMTKAQDELLKNLFLGNSTGNPIGAGIDTTERRSIDYSNITKVIMPEAIESSEYNTLDSNSIIYKLPSDILFIINEVFYKSTQDIRTIGNNEAMFAQFRPFLNNYLTNADNRTLSSTTTTTYKDIANNDVTVESGDFWYYKGLRNAIQLPPLHVNDNNEYTIDGTAMFTINSTIAKDVDYNKIFPELTLPNTLKTSVFPLHYNVYSTLISSPYKSPAKQQVWRIVNGGDSNTVTPTRTVEIIPGNGYYPANISFTITANSSTIFMIRNTTYGTGSYVVRYIRKPKPIILFPNIDNSVSIDGVYGYDASKDVDTLVPCELDSILHREIVQRAVELAKVAWSSDDVNKLTFDTTIGRRSE